MQARIPILLAAFGAVLLSGCANQASIFRTGQLDPYQAGSGSMRVLDGRERVIITAPHAPDSGTTIAAAAGQGSPATPVLVTCPDKGVDVYAAASMSGKLGVDAKSQSGEVSGSYSETAAALARKVTTDLIEDQQYRDCLLYQAGAIDKEVIAANEVRNRSQSFALLAIESLTNGPIAGGPTIQGGADNTISTLAAAYKDMNDADAKTATALTALTTVGGKKGDSGYSCDGAADPATCATKLVAYNSAAATSKKADDEYSALKTTAASAAPSAAAGSGTTAKPGQTGDGSTSPTSVASAVQNIVQMALSNDSDLRVFCLDKFQHGTDLGARSSDDLYNLCLKLITAQVNRATTNTAAGTPISDGTSPPAMPNSPTQATPQISHSRTGKGRKVSGGTKSTAEAGGSEPITAANVATTPTTLASELDINRRIYVQAPDENHRCVAAKLIQALQVWATQGHPIKVSNAVDVEVSPSLTQVRYYEPEQFGVAKAIRDQIASLGLDCVLNSRVGVVTKPQPGLFEVWIGTTATTPPALRC